MLAPPAAAAPAIRRARRRSAPCPRHGGSDPPHDRVGRPPAGWTCAEARSRAERAMFVRSSSTRSEDRTRWVSGLLRSNGEGVSRGRKSSKGRVATRPGGRSEGSVRGAGNGPTREWRRRARGRHHAPAGSRARGTDANPGQIDLEPRADWSTDSARSGGCVFNLRCWWKKIEHTSAPSVGPSAAGWSAAPNRLDRARRTRPEQSGYPPRTNLPPATAISRSLAPFR